MVAPAKPKKRKHREAWGAIRQLPSGRHQASYTGPDGNVYKAPSTFDGITDARGWLARKRVETEAEDWSPEEAGRASAVVAVRTETLGEFAKVTIARRTNSKGEKLRPRTRVEYERLIDGPLADLMGVRVGSVTRSMVDVWHEAQVATGAKTQTARAYGLLKSILSEAVAEGRLKSNPCAIKGAANMTTGKRVKPPTARELEIILAAITPRYRAAVILAAWAATRYGELTELRRKDLRLERVDGEVALIFVDVTRAVTHSTGVGYVIGETKSAAGVRSILLPPHVNGLILDHLAENVAPSPEALLFPAADGTTHLAESTFVKHWYPARKAADRDDMPWHALRHFGATRFAQTGATLKEIQERLGHSTAAAAMRYQHSAGRDEDLARRMSELARK